jgi:excisionase family DNA binding protein
VYFVAMMKNESDVQKTLYSIKEIADYLGISKGTLYKMTKQNKIPFYKVGKLIKFDRSEINAWVSNNGKMK